MSSLNDAEEIKKALLHTFNPCAEIILEAGGRATMATNEWGDHPQVQDRVDHVMLNFEKLINNHPDMNVRLRWLTKDELSLQNNRSRKKNEPDYWLGIAYAAYTKGVLDADHFKDVLLSLQARGAKSTYFKDIVAKALKGEI